MTTTNHESIFQRNIQRAVDKDFISFSADNSKITYYCSRDYTTSFKKPEEKVRASYFAELRQVELLKRLKSKLKRMILGE